MSERKLTKGTYYSCQHQQLSNSKCNACDTERERERESNLEQEREIKWKRYQELYNKKEREGFKFPDQEQQEIDRLEVWSREKLGGEYWSGGNFGGSLDKDPQGSNTAFYACKNNCSSGSIVEISSNMNVDDKRIKYEVKKDCYFGPHYQRQNDFTCATCYEKNNSPNLPSPSNPNQPNNPSPNNNSNPTIPNSVQEYFQANNVKKIELENNKWIITYNGNKSPKTIPVADTPAQIQPLRAYFQNNNKNSLTQEELSRINTSSGGKDKGNNYLPWILGIGGIFIVAIIIYFLTKRKKH